MKKLVILFILLIMLLPNTTMAEGYRVDSEVFEKGLEIEVPQIYDAMLVDIYEESITVYKAGVIDGLFYFPDVPSNLKYVVLFDGYEFISGSFHIISSECVHVYFWITDVDDFQRLDNLYLILIV